MAIRNLNIRITLSDNASKPLSEVDKSVDKTKSGFQALNGALQTLGGLGIGAVLTGFASKAIEESNRVENSLIGFRTVIKNSLGEDMVSESESAVKNLFQKLGGSMDMSSLQMSVKNLVNTGFDLQQSLDIVENNAYMASVNRQAHYKTIGEAVQVYTEGIKNNNAMLTDSTGISENLSVSLKKVGLKMDDLNNESKKAQVLQAIYNRHVGEASEYLGAFNTQMEGFQGQAIKANAALTTMTGFAGDFIKKALSPMLILFNPLLKYFADTERGADRIKTVMMFLTPVLIFLGAVAIGSVITGIYGMVEGVTILGVTFTAWFGWALAIGASLTALYLVLEDLFIFAKYGIEGSNTVFGEWLLSMGYTTEEIYAMRESVMSFFTFFVDSFNDVLDLFSELKSEGAEAFDTVSRSIDWVKENLRMLTAIGIVVLAPFTPLLIQLTGYVLALGLEFAATFVGAAIESAIAFGSMLAGYITLAATSLWAGAQMAMAWLIGLGPIGLIMLAVGALGAIIFYYWDEIVVVAENMWAGLKELFFNGIEFVLGLYTGMFDFVAEIFDGFMKNLSKPFEMVADLFGKPKIASTTMNITENVTRNVSERNNSSNFSSANNSSDPFGLFQRRASGGPVGSGQTVVVGDGGEPELFTPGASGFVTPMSVAMSGQKAQSSGPVTISLQFGDIVLNGNSSREAAQEFKTNLLDMLNEVSPLLAAKMGVA